MDTGRAEILCKTTAEMANPFGLVQGGIIAGIMDNVIGPASMTRAEGRRFVSVSMNVGYLKPARAGDVLRGVARVVKTGKIQMYVEGEITREHDGETVARGTCINIFT